MYETRGAVALTIDQRDRLRTLAPSIMMTPTVGSNEAYDLTPGSSIGVVNLGDLELVISPRLAIERVLFLISYAIGRGRWDPAPAHLADADSLVEAITPAFTYQLRRTLARGVLQGYRTEEDALVTLRGQWRVADQLRRRYGLVPPIEVTFDDFTEDILPNRLLRAAVERLLRLRHRDAASTWGLRAIDSTLGNVGLEHFDPRAVPVVRYDRLTERYRPAVELARLILAGTSFDVEPGGIAASAFLIDMNKVFEDFVVVALREALAVSDQVLVQGARRRPLHLDADEQINLEPDLSLWHGSVCTFVGDVKYKRVRSDAYPNADIYQLAAYTVGTNLPTGMLIYAAGEDEPATYEIPRIGKRLEVVALDLTKSPDLVLAQIAMLATRISEVAMHEGAVA